MLRRLLQGMPRNKISYLCLLLCLGVVCFKTVIQFYFFLYKCNFFSWLLQYYLPDSIISAVKCDVVYVIIGKLFLQFTRTFTSGLFLWGTALLVTMQCPKLRANYSSVISHYEHSKILRTLGCVICGNSRSETEFCRMRCSWWRMTSHVLACKSDRRTVPTSWAVV
jgi:hypothetical protein